MRNFKPITIRNERQFRVFTGLSQQEFDRLLSEFTKALDSTRLPTTYPSPAYTARPASNARANALTFCIPSQIALGPG